MSEVGKAGKAPSAGLGTFAGVFTPSVLTILGIILFLRLGYVVGSVGIVQALVIILLANTISLLTTISLSAVATNLRVKGGGDYYLISRTLGVEYGGALGLVLFLAQAVSIAFYALGFGEAVNALVGGAAWLPQAIAAGAVAALFVLAWLGADWATRFQYVVMVVLFAAIGAFLVGGVLGWEPEQVRTNVVGAGDQSFWVIFAIFFPAVTGFTQGVSMSGDLKNPGKSLPMGTFMAVGLSLVVYLVVAVIFAGATSAGELVADYTIMRQISAVPWLVDAGVIAATLSSALASFLGAPRILQSLASDRVFPFLNPFAVGAGPTNNPRRGVLLAAGIAFATIFVGKLNLIAPIVSMFFLISYGLLNYATFIEARANSPYFRPRFRYFDKRLSLLGGLGCLGAMLAIHPAAGLIAVALVFAVHEYVARTVSVSRWADSSRSNLFQRVRNALHAISANLDHARDWRPVILAFADSAESRVRMLRFAAWLEGNSGFTTALRLIEGSGTQGRKLQLEAERELRAEIDKEQLPAFAKVVVGRHLETLLPTVLQTHGLGRVRANTVLLNWVDDLEGRVPEAQAGYAGGLRRALRWGSNVVILSGDAKAFEEVEFSRRSDRVIDVWYRDNASGRMMLLLAYLMTRTEPWRDAAIRVLVPVQEGHEDAERARVEEQLSEARIAAQVLTVNDPGPREIVEHSEPSSVVFLPFRLSDRGPESVFGGSLSEYVPLLGVTAVVLASHDVPLDTDPESGLHADIAKAADQATLAMRSLAQVHKDAARAGEALTQAEVALDQAEERGAPEGEIAEKRRSVESRQQERERAERRVAKAEVKAEAAAATVRELTGEPHDPEAGDPAAPAGEAGDPEPESTEAGDDV